MIDRRKRTLVLWFPHLGAEHALRRAAVPPGAPFAVVEEVQGVQRIASTDAEARAAGLRAGRPLRDALASCGGLLTRPRDRLAEEAAMAALARWAGRFGPWVASWPDEGEASLALDVTGCAHLWGGEGGLVDAVLRGCAAMEITVRIGLADTPGAAWALARHAPDDATARGATPGGAGHVVDPRAQALRSAGAVAHHVGDASLLRRAGDSPEAGGAPPAPRGRRAEPTPRGLPAGPGTTARTMERPASLGAAHDPGSPLGADAIDQEAPATRARASRRAPVPAAPEESRAAVAPPGGTRAALAPLPVAALRIAPETAAGLSRVGLRRIADLLPMPRAALARRYGMAVVRRLDQALGAEPEPISPEPPPPRLSVRLTFPEPVGLEADMLAAIDRLLPALAERLGARGLAARRIRLEARRSEGDACRIEARPARPTADPERIRPLLAVKLGEIEAGFGIDAVRLEALDVEPVRDAPAERAPIDAGARPPATGSRDLPFVDLVGRIGARLGLEAIWRVQPTESHIPEKTHRTAYVAWSEPQERWPVHGPPRPLLLWPPEIVSTGAPEGSTVPPRFRWRGRTLEARVVSEPERIAPEWWLDDPEWRSGTRDYRRIATAQGDALWVFYAHGGRAGPGWFCQGAFA